MTKRQWIISFFAVLLLAGTVAFRMTAALSDNAASQEGPGVASESPAQVVYSAFFHFVVELKQQAADLEREGEKGESLRGYVQTQAGLNDEESRILNEIAAACVEEVSQQDAKALGIIETFRSQFPGGKIPRGVKPPPPPSELKVLQEERDQIILAARSKLVTALGEAGFNKVATFVEKRIAPGVQPAPPGKR